MRKMSAAAPKFLSGTRYRGFTQYQSCAVHATAKAMVAMRIPKL
jgi:hypothetical protein